MEKISTKRSRRPSRTPAGPMISTIDLAKLGDGEVAYIRIMSSDEAKRLFPTVEGLPDDIDIFALHNADGRPLALTDSWHSAMGHAMGDKLTVARLH